MTTTTSTKTTTDRRRKPHPAATSRVFAGWAGISAMLAMIGGFIHADRTQPPAPTPVAGPDVVVAAAAPVAPVAPATPASTVTPPTTTVPIQTVGITQRTVVISPVARTSASR
jgi:hypothetical protein